MEPLTGKAELIGRVRRALRGRAGGEREAALAAGPLAASAGERVALFRRSFEALGGVFIDGDPAASVAPALREALIAEGVAALLVPERDPAARSLADLLLSAGPFAVATAEEVRAVAPPVTAGIQSAEFAIAETGTLVQTSGAGRTFLPGLVTDVHVAVLSQEHFVDRIEECLAALSHHPPRNVSFITGPSRTADIELTLTIGVHGPRKVIAVLLSRG